MAQDKPEASFRVVVEAEDELYTWTPANNGAGPMWCYGSTCIARLGGSVYVSGIETVEDAKPLNNVRWVLFANTGNGWKLARKDDKGRTREPCPIAVLPRSRELLLSANPSLAAADVYSGPAQPQVLRFKASDLVGAPDTILPAWDNTPAFAEHSYRAFAADGTNGELILFQNVGYERAHWSFRDKTGKWSKHGQLVWPVAKEYDSPTPLRLCYANVALRNRAVHFFAVSDVVEPVKEWRAHKKELTGADWDYAFRRLYYTYTPDIASQPFREWIKLADRDSTAGYTGNADMHVDPQGVAHLIWTDTRIDTRLREKFFPAEKQEITLKYARISACGVSERTLLRWKEGEAGIIAGHTRLHATPDGRLFALCYCRTRDASGKDHAENRLMQITAEGAGDMVAVPFSRLMTNYMLATCRAGNEPSCTIDIYGNADDPLKLRYARLRIV